MGTTVDGIVSGLDTTSLISAVTTARRVSVETLQSRQSQFQAQKSAVTNLRGKMTDLSAALRALADPEQLRAPTVSSSAAGFTATAASDAGTGDYTVQVTALAKAQLSASQTVADPGAALFGHGTLGVTVGGVTTSVEIDDDTDSLQGLADALSEVDGLAAWVVNTGAGHRLVVQADDSGTAGAFSFDTSGLGGTLPAFAVTQPAADATVVVGGVTVTSSSNQVEGAIPGVTLDLRAVSGAPENLSVRSDDAPVEARLQAVVDAFNAMRTYYRTQTVYNAEAGIRGGLFGEATSRRAVEDLAGRISREFTVAGTDLASLAELGVKTLQDGSLELDTDVLDAALAADADGVRAFLTGATGAAIDVADRIDTLYVDSDDGLLVDREESIQATVDDLSEQIEEANDRITAETTTLRARFTAMEVALARINSAQSVLTSFFDSLQASKSSDK